MLISHHLTIKLHAAAANQIVNQIGHQFRKEPALYLVYLLSIGRGSDRKASGKQNKSVLKCDYYISTDSSKRL